jgi:arylsulfatase A-like enzyme
LGRCSRAASLCALLLVAVACGDAPAPRRLLLVTVDTLRADELGAYGSPRGLTPHLDALAEQSVVFDAAYAAASFTLPSLAALLTGRYPEALGIRSNESALPQDAGSLAAALAGRGWRTSAVVGNFVLRRSSGVDQGFQHFDDSFPRREAGPRGMPERTAADTTDAALALLDACADAAGCFVWAHYQDPHGPYAPPPGWRERALGQEQQAPDAARELPIGRDQWGAGSIPAYQALDGRRDLAFYRAGYRGEVAYVDAQIGRLLEGLSARGLDGETLVVFAADHGESLGEHDVWFSHGTRLDDAQVRVPLMIRAPGLEPRRRDDVASLVDLRPTLLALLADAPADAALPGRDLLAPDAGRRRGRAYVANLGVGGTLRYALLEDGFKFVASEREGLFDGRLERLGHADADLAAAAPQVAARLRSRLVELRARTATGVPETPQQLGDEDRAQLRALGYLAEEPDPQ